MKSCITVAVDFDGTLVTHRFPGIGVDAPHAVETLKKYQENNQIKIILYTMRDDKSVYDPNTGRAIRRSSESEKSVLQDAVNWCEERGIKLYGVNKNPSQFWSTSPKVYANLYVDDVAAGVPMTTLDNGETCVDWLEIDKIIQGMLK